jgi:hypothetical protein
VASLRASAGNRYCASIACSRRPAEPQLTLRTRVLRSCGQVAGHLAACNTATVAYHEAFWVVIGAAAPVVALAVIVSLPDSLTLAGQADMDRGVNALREAANGVYRLAARIFVTGLINMLLQAGLLAVSLVSIEDGANCVPPWTAITATVGGIVLLGVASVMTVNTNLYRKRLKLIGGR